METRTRGTDEHDWWDAFYQGRSDAGKAIWCGVYASGIIGFLLVYGVLQERIMTEEYAGDQFGLSPFLVLCNRLATILFSLFMIACRGEQVSPQAPIWKYCLVSISNVAASEAQYEALKHISFPVQMLAKSFKMMPVMLWGIVISAKVYGFEDWSIATLVTGGVIEFLLTGPIADSSHPGSEWVGLTLLCCYLVFDGFTSPFQEHLFSQHNTSKCNQMLYIGTCAAALSLLQLLAFHELTPALEFCRDHPNFLVDVIVLSSTNVFSQFCIYSMIREFGALVFAATMNVRQVVSIIVSYVEFNHIITFWQVVGLLMVFGALGYKSYRGVTQSKSMEREPLVDNQDNRTVKNV